MEGQDQWGAARRRIFGLEVVLLAFGRHTALPAFLLLLLFVGSDLIALHNPYFSGAAPSLPFVAALLLRVAGTYVLSVAILRRAVGSGRRPWTPDGCHAERGSGSGSPLSRMKA